MIGVIGKKRGMTQVFDESGRVVPVTVVQVIPQVVIGKKSCRKRWLQCDPCWRRRNEKIACHQTICRPISGGGFASKDRARIQRF